MQRQVEFAAPIMHRYSLDRFKKAQTEEPFSVSNGSVVPSAGSEFSAQARSPFASVQVHTYLSANAATSQMLPPGTQKILAGKEVAALNSSIGDGQSTWQPPDWAVKPSAGLYWLNVVKDGEVVDKINLDKHRNIFGRQAIMCDFVLDHPSVSRQHAAVVQHKNGSVYVIDLGSVHGTFVANDRLSKDSPVELEVGQSLKFAASTRVYVLQKGMAQIPHLSKPPVNFVLPPPPNPSDEEAVVAYNTLLNKVGMFGQGQDISSTIKKVSFKNEPTERAFKRARKGRVTFRDQYNGVLVEVVGTSDGADVGTEPGPLGVKEGSLVGRFDDLVEITVIPKGKDSVSMSSLSASPRGVTHKLQQFIEKVKSPAKGSLYDDAIAVSAPWANLENDASVSSGREEVKKSSLEALSKTSSSVDDDLDDLFVDA